MKKLFVLSALVLGLAACGNNQYAQNQSFGATQATTAPISVKQALSVADDSYITVEGNIVSQVDDDEYIFTDGTAQIRVEIDDHIWRGQNVGTKDKIRLFGKVDKEWTKTELKVKELTLVQ